MDGDGKVRSGESFNIPAKLWNEFCDAAKFVKNRTVESRIPESEYQKQDFVYVKNTSGNDFDVFEGMYLPNVIQGPQTNESAPNLNRFVFNARSPETNCTGIPAIALEKIRDGQFGRAAIGGTTLALINGARDGKNFINFSTNCQTPADSGFARILWDRGGTTERIAQIHFCTSPAEKTKICLVSITGGTPITGYTGTIVNDFGSGVTASSSNVFFPIAAFTDNYSITGTRCLCFVTTATSVATSTTIPSGA